MHGDKTLAIFQIGVVHVPYLDVVLPFSPISSGLSIIPAKPKGKSSKLDPILGQRDSETNCCLRRVVCTVHFQQN